MSSKRNKLRSANAKQAEKPIQFSSALIKKSTHFDDVTILEELKDLIRPLSTEEYSMLEDDIIKNGCKEKLEVWERSEGEYILVDGHNRYSICKRREITFGVKNLLFGGIEEVKTYIITKQLARRNLSKLEISYYRGLDYLNTKNEHGGDRKSDEESSLQNDNLKTSEILSEKYKVSPATIIRDSKFALGVEKLSTQDRNTLFIGDSILKKKDVEYLGQNEIDVEVYLESLRDPSPTPYSTKSTQPKEAKSRVVPDFGQVITKFNSWKKTLTLNMNENALSSEQKDQLKESLQEILDRLN